jgi:hypothetical protein
VIKGIQSISLGMTSDIIKPTVRAEISHLFNGTKDLPTLYCSRDHKKRNRKSILEA